MLFQVCFIHTRPAASTLIHLSIFAPTCQLPRCVRQQKKYQQQGEEIKTKPECGRRSTGDRGAVERPQRQGVSQVKCSIKPIKTLTSIRQQCSICRVCVLSKVAVPEENQEPSDGLITSNVSPLPASCIRPQYFFFQSCRTERNIKISVLLSSSKWSW